MAMGFYTLIQGSVALIATSSNRDIDEAAFSGNRQMIAEQRKLPGESKYPVVS
jgi:hypothetical protein